MLSHHNQGYQLRKFGKELDQGTKLEKFSRKAYISQKKKEIGKSNKAPETHNRQMPLCLTEKLSSTKIDHSLAKWQMFLSNLVLSNAPKINQYNQFFIYNRVIQTSWSDRKKETGNKSYFWHGHCCSLVYFSQGREYCLVAVDRKKEDTTECLYYTDIMPVF